MCGVWEGRGAKIGDISVAFLEADVVGERYCGSVGRVMRQSLFSLVLSHGCSFFGSSPTRMCNSYETDFLVKAGGCPHPAHYMIWSGVKWRTRRFFTLPVYPMINAPETIGHNSIRKIMYS